jgi:large subunit ribosomal protein L9
MKVILLKDIKGVGRKFEEKEVASGYAANYLIPKNLAVTLSGTSASSVKVLKEKEERAQEKRAESLTESVSKIKGINFQVPMKANKKGHLFAALTAHKISELLKEKEGIEIDPQHLILPEPIKEIGTFEVLVSIEGKKTNFTLEVVPLD